ncbi:MarR family winged helix-turn-helix transcriptional regulator [Candidatus Zixiibacteriota bacterium]
MAVFDQAHRAESLPARIALTLLENGVAAQASKTIAARNEGLPTLQASLLIHMHTFNGNGSTVGVLADRMQLTPPTISDSMKALVRKGLLTRKKSEEDGRVAYFHLTNKGHELAYRLQTWADPIEESIRGLTRKQQLDLLGALTRVLRDQVDAGFAPAEAMCVSCGYFRTVSEEGQRFYCERRDELISLEELCTDCPNHIACTGN